MTVDNPTIVTIGIFTGVFIILATIALAVGLLGNNNKILEGRLRKIKSRHGKANKLQDLQKKNLFIRKEKSFFEQFVPNPDELRKRFTQTGRKITLTNYVFSNLAVAVVVAILMFTAGGLSILTSLTVGIFAGLFLPHMYINRAIKKRLEKFNKQFPEAIDLIVRGLQAGLPVTESIAAVAQEMKDPIAKEFRTVTEEIQLGKTLNNALWAVSERLDTPEFKFFIISLSVQQETGGNLSETLQNLSDILRGRQRLKLKIRAMSSEGKASAYIIGGLPFIMFGLITALNFGYMSVMWTDPRGQMALLLGLVWLGLGMFIISKMISFEV